jgi:hypothetical protein
LNTSNSKTEAETPTVTLTYSRADGGLEWEIRLFRRFQDEFYLTRRELHSQDTHRFQPVEFRIEPAEYFDVLNALRHVQVPIVPAAVPLRLGPYSKLSISGGASDVTFKIKLILALRSKYSEAEIRESGWSERLKSAEEYRDHVCVTIAKRLSDFGVRPEDVRRLIGECVARDD